MDVNLSQWQMKAAIYKVGIFNEAPLSKKALDTYQLEVVNPCNPQSARPKWDLQRCILN